MLTTLKKRNGTLTEFDARKLKRWAEWAAGVGIDWQALVEAAIKKCHDGCTTDDLHNALIAACIDMETTAHLKMANRLYIGALYKKTFGDWRCLPPVKVMYHHMTKLGYWAEMDYTEEELDIAQSFIRHDLDLQATLTETKQIVDKYAIRDRVTGRVYETPQFMYMRMALGNMERMPKDRRMEDVRKLYTFLSQKKINPPSPFSLNLGTAKKQYASCCVITTEDTIDSLAAADHIAYKMTAASAGIGGHMKTRSKGDKVRGGLIKHMGKLPYLRMRYAAVAANMQASRGGANTEHINCLDPELRTLLKLKNEQTVLADRIRDLDYSLGYNPYFIDKALENKRWMLVSYGDAPELYELFYSSDLQAFIAEYERVAMDPNIKKEFVPARDIARWFLPEAVETGRFYEHNAHEMNRHTPFKCTIYSSNLCQEIGLPTKGYKSVADLYKETGEHGEIGLCSLAAIAAGLVTEAEYEEVAYYAALMIDNVIDIMEYPFPHLAHTAKMRRSIGVGITNLAYAMAKEGLKYSSLEGKQFIHRLAERHSFWLHKASVRLAWERGACGWYDKTKYSDGWLPIDTANQEIRKIVGQELLCDWERIREGIRTFGVRFSVLEAHMPTESSAVASGHTNGLYPIRAYKVVKTSGTNKVLFIAPDIDTLKDRYELAWDIPTKDLTEVYAVVQCFTGQAISADYYIKFDSKGKRQLSMKTLLLDWAYRCKLGLKTKYYTNSATGVVLDTDEKAEEEEADDSCSACKL
jgi:ribonucleoside-diphosphate reductase alpha chain